MPSGLSPDLSPYWNTNQYIKIVTTGCINPQSIPRKDPVYLDLKSLMINSQYIFLFSFIRLTILWMQFLFGIDFFIPFRHMSFTIQFFASLPCHFPFQLYSPGPIIFLKDLLNLSL